MRASGPWSLANLFGLLAALAPGCGSAIAVPWDVAGDASDTPADASADASTADEMSDAPGAADVDAGPVDAGPEPDLPPVVPSDWAVGRLGDTGVLSRVHVVDATEAYAAGGTRVLRWTGAAWASYGEPGGDSGLEVHGVGAVEGGADEAATVVAAGEAGLIAWREPGALGWTEAPVTEGIETKTLRGVLARSAGEVWVVGDDGTVLRGALDGQAFEVLNTGGTHDLMDLWGGPLGGEVVAVATGGRLFRDPSGAGSWAAQQIAGAQTELSGVWGTGDVRVAVGAPGTITLKPAAGASWQGQVSNDTQGRDPLAVVGSAADSMLVVGSAGLVVRYDGDKWNVEALPSGPLSGEDLVDVGRPPSADTPTVVVARGGGVLWDAGEGAGFQAQPTQPQGGLVDLAEGPDGTLWGVGPGGLMMTRAADTGLWAAVATRTAEDLHGVDVDAAGVVVAAGGGGTVLRWTPDPAVAGAGVLEAVDTPVPVDLAAVAFDADGGLIVGGKGGTLLVAASAEGPMTPRASGTVSDLTAACLGGDGAVWLVGGEGRLLRMETDGKPDLVGSGTGSTLHDVVALDGGDVVAVGDGGTIVEVIDGAASVVAETPGLFLYGVSSGAGETFAVGWNGTVLRRTAESWDPEVSGTSSVLEAVWHDAGGAVATGRQGVALERLEAP